jgi:hypothetical protein
MGVIEVAYWPLADTLVGDSRGSFRGLSSRAPGWVADAPGSIFEASFCQQPCEAH